jgi:hypothetical protein
LKNPTQKHHRKTVPPAVAIAIIAMVLCAVIAIYYYALAPKTLSDADRQKALEEARKFWGGATPSERGGLKMTGMWTPDEMKVFIKEHGRPPTSEEAQERMRKMIEANKDALKSPTTTPTRRLPAGVIAP